ncbi:protein SRC2 homolog [Malania oleifera]|uniref:protein SRC2 homolog n=1 Tax=Malania oleifera TaxID=397392 RepID=UPI0025ADFB86|nr:protein SRC2 homolog [Malania oleifera]
MASSRPSPGKPLDLDITIVSAKHLKNVNWRHGDLKPYAIFWLDPDHRIATKPDDAGSTRPVWNERFTVPIATPLQDSLLTLEIFHSKPSETPKPLVGTLRSPLTDLLGLDEAASNPIRTLELRRPSGRPQGKIRIKLTLRERPSPPPPQITPPPSYYYSTAPSPPPNPARDYREYSPPPPYGTAHPPPPPPPANTLPYSYGAYSDPYQGYYPGYYSMPPPPLPPRPFFDRTAPNYNVPSGPSAPVDYSSYDHKQKGGSKMGVGAGLAVGAVAGTLGGLALEEGIKYEEEKIAERVESDIAARDDYSSYRSDY